MPFVVGKTAFGGGAGEGGMSPFVFCVIIYCLSECSHGVVSFLPRSALLGLQ